MRECVHLSSTPHCLGLLGWGGCYLLQVVKLHCDLSEEEVDVAAPLHRMHEVGLCRRGAVRTRPLT